MADSVNSLKVNSAKGRSSRDLSFDHVSTIDFNVVKPMGIFEMVPGDHINISPELWMRTQKMPVPTFGKMDVITRAFFVPLRLTWKHFNDFYRNAPVQENGAGVLNYFTTVPHCKMHDISMRFETRFKLLDSAQEFNNYKRTIENMDGIAHRLYFGASAQTGVSSVSEFDFSYRSGASVIVHKFNPIGKRVYDLFNSLGYRWQFFVPDNPTTSNKGTDANMYDVSVLPLLGWLKMFKDWFCPSEYKYLFSDNIVDVRPNVDQYFLDMLFDELTWAVYIYFNDDIFSMCEQQPYKKGNAVGDSLLITQLNGEPNSLLHENRQLEWHTNSIATDSVLGGRINSFGSQTSDGYNYLTSNGKPIAGVISNTSDSRKAMQAVGYTNNYGDQASIPLNQMVSNWSVMAVMRTAQWLQRNNLLSSRVTEYLKAKFGVTPSAARLDIAEYIGHAGSPVRISDIAGTGDNNLAELGAKGTSYNVDKFGYTAEEFGYLYFTVELRPRIGYGQGVDPLVLRVSNEEFYNQEFDSLGFEPVPTECLVSGPLQYHYNEFGDETMNNGAPDNRIFGYLPRMWSYKCKHDNLSGDFALPNLFYRGDLQAYHLMRMVDGADVEDFVHNTLSFRYAGLSRKENRFNRIFYQNDNLYDPFMMICSFNAWSNGLPLAMNESWQVNADHDEREGHLTNIQGSL